MSTQRIVPALFLGQRAAKEDALRTVPLGNSKTKNVFKSSRKAFNLGIKSSSILKNFDFDRHAYLN